MLEQDFLATPLCYECSSGSGACTYIREERVNKEWAAPNSNTLLPSLFDIRFRRVFLVCLPRTDPKRLCLHSKLPAGVGKAQVDARSSGREHGSSLHPEREQARQRGKAMQIGPFWEELSSSPFLWAHTDLTSDSRNNTEQMPSCQAGVILLPLKSMLSDTDKDTV